MLWAVSLVLAVLASAACDHLSDLIGEWLLLRKWLRRRGG